MTLSVLDNPVYNPKPHMPPPKAHHKGKDAGASAGGGQNAERVSFGSGENKSCKVTAFHQSPDRGQASQCHNRQPSNEPSSPFTQLRQAFKSWWGGQRPPRPDPCPTPPCSAKPPRPDPCLPPPCNTKPPEPDPCPPPPCYNKPSPPPKPCRPEPPEPCRYERNDKLLEELVKNFGEFQKLSCKSYITTNDIKEMAREPFGESDKKDQSIHLAQALLKHPELINAIDRHSTTGALDEIIDLQKIEMTLNSKSPYKYFDDKYLADEIFKHFSEFTSMKSSDYISVRKLKRIASQSTELPGSAHLTWMAQELLKRSETLEKLDDDVFWGKGKWIHKDALLRMSY
ncbi:hypothetical protein [Pseudomonas sp. 18175]|uniref:hypothetical protein n=1 Tax=Pseudomonas sp. 18175 TaxID=3390056 RepID=UPI003D21A987